MELTDFLHTDTNSRKLNIEKFCGVGIVKIGCGQSDHDFLSQKSTDDIN